MWVPSHIGINGNEDADRIANEAILDNIYNDYIPVYKDVSNEICRRIRNQWDQEWRSKIDNKLWEIKKNTNPWNTSNRPSRKEMTIITRLRIGHTNITHKYIMAREERSKCRACNTNLSTKHLLLECPQYEDFRRAAALNNSIEKALGDDEKEIKIIIQFLKMSGLYNKI